MKNHIALFLMFVGGFAFADNYPRNETIDINRYIFKLDLNDTTDIITGEATVHLLARKSFTEFELDLVNQNVEKKGMLVSGVSLNGKEIRYIHLNNRLKIFLPVAAKINETISITICYSGIPLDGLIISKNKFGDRTFFGDNWPDRARNWLPCMDHPYEKAAVDFIVTAPPHYTVVGNGVKVEESFIKRKQKLTHWREDVDLATKVMVIGVARFAIQYVTTVDAIPVESWVYPQNRTEGFFDYAPAAKILDFFNSKIGPYSYKKLANVQSTTIYGGMENASNIFYFEKSVTGKGEIDNLLAHEIAHQWFGNSASENDWHHVWLSEGFATYFTHIYNEFMYGKDQMRKDLLEDRKLVVAYCKKSAAPVINNSIIEYTKLLTPHVYHRGSWVLHMLRAEIGDQFFWNGIREYYRQYQNNNASTSDLQLIMENASGKNLDTFFQQWLNRAELPSLKVSWSYNETDKIVGLTIEQTQAGLPFILPLEVGLYYNNENVPTIEKIKIDQKTQKINIFVSKKPSKVLLDPNINLLFEEILKN